MTFMSSMSGQTGQAQRRAVAMRSQSASDQLVATAGQPIMLLMTCKQRCEASRQHPSSARQHLLRMQALRHPPAPIAGI